MVHDHRLGRQLDLDLVGNGDAPVEPAPQDHSHIEEELSEGDIQGSFAHGI